MILHLIYLGVENRFGPGKQKMGLKQNINFFCSTNVSFKRLVNKQLVLLKCISDVRLRAKPQAAEQFL